MTSYAKRVLAIVRLSVREEICTVGCDKDYHSFLLP